MNFRHPRKDAIVVWDFILRKVRLQASKDSQGRQPVILAG